MTLQLISAIEGILSSAYEQTPRRHPSERVAALILDQLHTLIEYSRATLQIKTHEGWVTLAEKKSPHRKWENWGHTLLQSQRQLDSTSPGEPRSKLDQCAIMKVNEPCAHLLFPLIHGSALTGHITLQCNINAERLNMATVSPCRFINIAKSILCTSILQEELANLSFERAGQREYSEAIVQHFSDQRNLAVIGLVYGESIHFAKNKLGIAKTLASDICMGLYDSNPKKLKAEARRIAEYISAYLKVLNQIQSDALEVPGGDPIEIHQMLRQIIQSKRIPKNVRVHFSMACQNPIVNAPPAQLRQIFFVVIQNALDAMRLNGGCLSIETKVENNSPRQRIQVQISDTGMGISEEIQKTLFKMRTSSHKARGSGLGLVWARSFLRSYGGDIEFETSKGVGTRMIITVPQDFGRTASVIER